MKSFALICSVFIGVSLATKEFKEFKEICGIENVATSDRIINGIEASPNQFPWAVFIKIHIGHQIGTCTGSVISKNFILTAAHCLKGVSKAEIYAGTHDYSLESEPHRQYRVSENLHVHPNYVNTLFTYQNDIGLIELDEELEFNDFVRPACLPTLADVDTNLVGENTTISGWGRIRGEPNPLIVPQLMYATDVPVMSNDVCRMSYGSIINEKIICLNGYSVQKFTCNGDSGGPLNHEVSEGKYTQIGVTNFGADTTCVSRKPVGFARVSSFLEWIESTTGIKVDSE
ncbi:brachyurin [Lepeophtheirus salmonis]|uniref:brachyurin n=1 Tax=Lepeophtheirus salmonis TaxID=72036 RepID=UPI001AE66C4A|nr:brachyurin-like [Lepeophtheirus salmonis]